LFEGGGALGFTGFKKSSGSRAGFEQFETLRPSKPCNDQALKDDKGRFFWFFPHVVSFFKQKGGQMNIHLPQTSAVDVFLLSRNGKKENPAIPKH
jgi:hypothetical protein